MAIQHRRGADVDFKAEKMLPGEIAVTIDGTRKVYAAFAPGDVKELASKEEVQKIVDNFENSVDEKINEAVQQVTDEATEQVEGIVAKGEEILNSIPVDYQETVKEVVQLKEDLTSTIQSKADAIICEAEGTTIVATDSSDAGFEGLSLYGKSKQGSTTGAQLLDYSVWKTVAIIKGTGVFENNGITITASENDAHTDYTVGKCRILVSEGETITLSWESDDDINGQVYIFPNGNIVDAATANNKYEKSVSYTVSSGITFITFRFGTSEAGNTIHYKNIMINKGTEPLPWEPYTNCKSSPNPKYSQEVVSVGDGGSIEGKVCRKNLLKNTGTTQTKNGVTFTVNEDKSVTCNGTATAITSLVINYTTKLEYGQKYILSGCPNNGSDKSYSLRATRGIYGRDNGSGLTCVQESNEKIYIYIEIYSGITVSNLVFKPMIRLASIEDDTYEPYKEQTITLQTPNGLPGIQLGTIIPDVIKNSPIHMSGVYWDNEEGQYYIADTKNENGRDVQRIGKYILRGGMNWQHNSDGTALYNSSLLNDSIATGTDSVLGKCNKLPPSKTNPTVLDKAYVTRVSTDKGLRFSNVAEVFGIECTSDAFNAYLSVNPIDFSYILAAPIETPLSDEEIAAYKALHTNKPTTTIMNSENVFMKAKYVADTKNHIKQNYIPLSKYTALEERVAAIEELVIS